MTDEKPPPECEAEILARLREYGKEAAKGLFSHEETDSDERGPLSGSADLFRRSNKNREIVLKWSTGKPILEGLYFVAVKYGACAGEFQFAIWDGQAWKLQPVGDVEAFVDIESLKNQLNIQWPK